MLLLRFSLFFRGAYMLKEFNHTNISLIPKMDNPSQVNYFLPIKKKNKIGVVWPPHGKIKNK
jgi:hypothetical protein